MFTSDRARVFAFLAGAETFHALAHAYLSLSRRQVEHPVQWLGIKPTRRFHAGAAMANAAIALGLGVASSYSTRAIRPAA